MSSNLAAPPWFLQAVSAQTRSQHLDIAGSRLHVRSWAGQGSDAEPLLFVHGFLANSHWWDWIAPFFSDRFAVHALDLSGMGGSGHRDRYDWASWQDEIAGVADWLGGRVRVVGHSYGGARTLESVSRYPHLFKRTVLVDSYIHFADYPPRPQSRGRRSTPNCFPSVEAAIQRYRLLPDQPAPDHVVDYLARHAVRRQSEGWSWQYDELGLTAPRALPDSSAMLGGFETPLALVHGEYSRVASRDMMARVASACQAVDAVVEIPMAHHHVMIDQPLPLVTCLRALL